MWGSFIAGDSPLVPPSQGFDNSTVFGESKPLRSIPRRSFPSGRSKQYHFSRRKAVSLFLGLWVMAPCINRSLMTADSVSYAVRNSFPTSGNAHISGRCFLVPNDLGPVCWFERKAKRKPTLFGGSPKNKQTTCFCCTGQAIWQDPFEGPPREAQQNPPRCSELVQAELNSDGASEGLFGAMFSSLGSIRTFPNLPLVPLSPKALKGVAT